MVQLKFNRQPVSGVQGHLSSGAPRGLKKKAHSHKMQCSCLGRLIRDRVEHSLRFTVHWQVKGDVFCSPPQT